MATTLDDFEIQQHINALGASSSRVRFTMLTLVIACVAALVTLGTEREDAWARDRLQKAARYRQVADVCGLWYEPTCVIVGDCNRQIALISDDPKKSAELKGLLANLSKVSPLCSSAAKALKWLSRYGLKTREDARAFSEKQWEHYIANVTYVKTPVLGLTFDINDLGVMTGTTLVFVMLVMFYSTHRSHENLVLAMWKVRDLCAKEDAYDQPGSKANLLYHALAMEQVFTVPPTLARWGDFLLIRFAHYALLFLPCVVQILVLVNDKGSTPIGNLTSPSATEQSLFLQTVLAVIVFFLFIFSVLHLWADDKEWRATFTFINPLHIHRAKSPWRYWVQLFHNKPPGWGIVREPETGIIYFADTIRGRTMKLECTYVDSRQSILRLTAFAKIATLGLRYDDKLKSLHRHLPITGGVPEDLGATFSWSEPPFPGPGQTNMTPKLIGYLEERGSWYYLSRTHVAKVDNTGRLIWEVGRKSHQQDGQAADAGFHRITAQVIHDGTLFLTDGGWVRSISPDGEVSTWGGKPLGEFRRREPPYLLGLAYVADNLSASGPYLLVCDFTLRRLFRVWKNRVEEAYRSPRGWSPAGILVDKDGVLLLEYRLAKFRNSLITGRYIGDYVRIRQGSLQQLHSLSDLISLSRLQAFLAEHRREGIVLPPKRRQRRPSAKA